MSDNMIYKNVRLKIHKNRIHIFIFIYLISFILSCDGGIDEKIIRYSVSGTSTHARIEYKFGNEIITLENESLPWKYEYKIWADDKENYSANICAEKITGDNSSIILEIFVDGSLGNYVSFSDPNEEECIQLNVALEGHSDDD